MRRAKPPDLGALSASEAERVSRICDDFEAAWQRAVRPDVREFMGRAGEGLDSLSQLVLLRELLTAELELSERDSEFRTIDAHREACDLPGADEVIDFVLGEQARADSARRFRTIKYHAAGGLGEVFVAHDEQLERQVAVKRIRPELAEKEGSRERFVREAEVTGQLEHPNIAPVYALGLDREKLLFYAMRFIEGESLEDAIGRLHRVLDCRNERGERLVSLRKLLGNFTAVCNGVAFAHSREIIHRDIKPANVVLGPFGETILVDWGLAKRLGSPAMDPVVTEVQDLERGGDQLTDHGAVLGTLAYMSPEQAETATGTASKASDIYSLGATLYHLVTGREPFVEEDRTELRRKVIHGEFAPPRAVDSRIPPALDAIVCKAMARNPRERYATATELAEDVEHWLADEPVKAGREPLRIRTGRWTRRHRSFVVGASAALFVGVIGLAGLAAVLGVKNRELESERRQVVNERDRAESEAEVAKAVEGFLNKDVLAQAGAEFQAGLGTRPDPDLKVREALFRAAAKNGERFVNRPIVEASIRQTIGEAYFSLGLFPEALKQLERARTIRQRDLGENHPDTLETAVTMGRVYLDDGKPIEAEPLLIGAMNGLRGRLSAHDPRVLIATHGVAQLYFQQGRLLEAEKLLLSLRDAYQRLPSAEPSEALDAADSLAVVYEAEQKYEQAEQLLTVTIDEARQRLGTEHPTTINAMSNLAQTYRSRDKLPEAEQLWTEVLQARRSFRGEKHPETLYTLVVLGGFYMTHGKVKESEPYFREALDGCRTAFDRNHDTTEMALMGLATVYTSRIDLEKLEPVLKEAGQISLAKRGRDHANTARANSSLASLCLVTGRYSNAEPYFREVLAYCERNGDGIGNRYHFEAQLGLCLVAQRKFEDARSHLLVAYYGIRAGNNSAPEPDGNDLGSLLWHLLRLRGGDGRPLGQSIISAVQKDPKLGAIVMDLFFPTDPFGPQSADAR